MKTTKLSGKKQLKPKQVFEPTKLENNEKAVDKLDRDLKEFRAEIKEDIKSVKKNTDNLIWKLVATLAGSVILNILVNKFV